MVRGTVGEALHVSSDKCTADSAPRKAFEVEIRPIKVAAPAEGQSPPLLNVSQTSAEETLGASAQRGTITGKKAMMLKSAAPQMLKAVANKANATFTGQPYQRRDQHRYHAYSAAETDHGSGA